MGRKFQTYKISKILLPTYLSKKLLESEPSKWSEPRRTNKQIIYNKDWQRGQPIRAEGGQNVSPQIFEKTPRPPSANARLRGDSDQVVEDLGLTSNVTEYEETETRQ